MGGVWRRAGMDGALCGIDIPAALAATQAHGGGDSAVLIALIEAYETGAMSALERRRKFKE